MDYSLGTVCIRPKDYEESVKFYRDILGLKLTMECVISGEHNERITTFKAGAIEIELVDEVSQRYPMPDVPKGGVPDIYFCLKVSDLDKAYQDMKNKRVEIHIEPVEITSGIRVFFIKGPSGEVIEIMEEKVPVLMWNLLKEKVTGKPVNPNVKIFRGKALGKRIKGND
jgi:lactoylglutathione lyase